MRPTGAVATGLLMLLGGCAGAIKAVDVAVPGPAVQTNLAIAGLSSADSEMRAQSAWSLAGARDMKQEAIVALEPLRGDSVRDVRYAAVWALGHLKGPDVVGPAAIQGSSPARLLRATPPKYPQDAFAKRVEGTVLVEMLIGEDGEVAHATIRRSIKAFDEAALACVRGWTFEPARVSGVARASLAHAPVIFRIY